MKTRNTGFELTLKSENIKTNNLEFIFNEEKVGFCYCLINE